MTFNKFGNEFIHDISIIVNELRTERNVSIYPDFVKLSKQFTYADKNKFNYVIISWTRAEEKEIKIKNLKNRDV